MTNNKLPKPHKNKGCFLSLHAWGGWQKHGNGVKIRICKACGKQQKR